MVIRGGVDGNRDGFEDIKTFFESLVQGRDDDDRVDVALKKREGLGEDFTSFIWKKYGYQIRRDEWIQRTDDDDGCRAIPNLLILCATEFNHVLCCRMSNFNFSQNGISVICESFV